MDNSFEQSAKAARLAIDMQLKAKRDLIEHEIRTRILAGETDLEVLSVIVCPCVGVRNTKTGSTMFVVSAHPPVIVRAARCPHMKQDIGTETIPDREWFGHDED